MRNSPKLRLSPSPLEPEAVQKLSFLRPSPRQTIPDILVPFPHFVIGAFTLVVLSVVLGHARVFV